MGTDPEKEAVIKEVERLFQEFQQSPDFNKRINLKVFSPEAMYYLKKLNCEFFEIGALSIASMVAENYPLAVPNLFVNNSLKIMDQSSTLSEVAVCIGGNHDVNVIVGSNNQRLLIQQNMLKAYEKQLLQIMPDIKVEMGDLWDYTHLAYEIFRKRGFRIFSGWRARTKTPTSMLSVNTFGFVGGYDTNNKLCLGDSLGISGDLHTYACPLIFPA